jgi:hypothetical protein
MRIISSIPLLIVVLYTLPSCRKTDQYVNKAKPEVVLSAGQLRVAQPEVHLFKDTVYVISSSLVFQQGQRLTIDPGTLVKVEDEQSITFNAGSSFNIVGTSDAPIVFTSSAPMGTAGAGGKTQHSWGGIVVNGKSGNSSGLISHLRIEFAAANRPFGALTLTSIDSSTVIDHIQVSYSGTSLKSSGAAVVLSGGNCRIKYITCYASFGNDIVASNAFTGALQFGVVLRHPFFPIFNLNSNTSGNINFSGLRIEGQGTNPQISNLSVVGPDIQSGVDGTYQVVDDVRGRTDMNALLLTGGARCQIQNSIIAGFPKAGFYLDDANSAIALNAGSSAIRYTHFQAADTTRTFVLPSFVFPPFGSSDFRSLMLQPSFHNVLAKSFADLALKDPFKYDGYPDVAPKQGSPLSSAANFDNVPAGFFQKVSFIGGIGDENWMSGWTNFQPLQTNYNN